MKLFTVLVAVFGLLTVHAADIETEENVLILTDDNFDGAIANNKYILVEFYAPWCGHCKALTPEFAKAATQLESEQSEVKLSKLDATVHKAAAEKFQVKGYPTLKFFKDGTAMEYGGGRTSVDIVNWLKKKTGPPTTTLTTEEAFNKLKDANDVVVVGYFSDVTAEASTAYTGVADSFDDVPFAVVSDSALAATIGLEDGKVAVFKKDYKSPLYDSNEKLLFNVRGERVPLLEEMDTKSAPKIFGGDIQNHALLFLSKAGADFKTHTDNFKTAAAEFKGQMLFIYIDSDQEENKRVMEFFGLSDKDVPTYRVIKMAENMAKYKPEELDLSADAVIKFAQGVLGGVAKRHLMTEEVPADWNTKPVSILVGKNFKEVAYDSNKKVFVEFYAPWCGHCKSLAPIWDQLGEKFGSDENVVIAKMDSTANEVEDFEIQGFPTLKYFPSGSDKVVDYNGDRTLDAMTEFVSSNGEKANEPSDGLEPPTEPYYGNDLADVVQHEGDEDELAEFDRYIEEIMKNSLPNPMDEEHMMKELEQQMRAIMESIEKTKKAELPKKEEL